jgi:uncharacterized protein (DUF1501 family)
MLTRRDILRAAGVGAAATILPTAAFARVDTNARFVLVILRGAADGLGIAAPYGDGNYRKVRGELALPDPGQNGGLLKLDSMFGLHPSLPGVYAEYEKKQALMAVNTPLVLRGENSVTSWAPSQLPDAEESTIRRLQDLYADDEFFATRLTQALKSQEIADDAGGMMKASRRTRNAEQVRSMMEATARFLTAEDGPRIAVVEAGGWDTHQNQGVSTGGLANRLAGLDDGLATLRDGLGSTWSDTVVAVVTEFGRTVHVNGTRGTDHGTATAAILLGGALADWPGLRKSDLYEGRDLMPTTDARSLFKGILADHLEVPDALLERSVFPDSAAAPPMKDLIRG